MVGLTHCASPFKHRTSRLGEWLAQAGQLARAAVLSPHPVGGLPVARSNTPQAVRPSAAGRVRRSGLLSGCNALTYSDSAGASGTPGTSAFDPQAASKNRLTIDAAKKRLSLFTEFSTLAYVRNNDQCNRSPQPDQTHPPLILRHVARWGSARNPPDLHPINPHPGGDPGITKAHRIH